MTAVNIYATLWLVPDEGGRLDLTCSWDASVGMSQGASPAGGHDSAMGDLPEGTDNIVLRAVQSLRDRGGGTWGARLRLLKRIPSAAGLGGASSDAAAALVAAAADIGASTVVLSDRLTAPAARRAGLSLAIRSDNMTFTNAVAAMTVVINGLATAIATRHRDDAIDAFAKISRVHADDPDVLTGDR